MTYLSTNLQNLPANHDFVQCDFWHLHYVRKNQLDSHLANCEHRLEKEAFKITWKCMLLTNFYIRTLSLDRFDCSLVSSRNPEIFPAKIVTG